MALPVSVGNCLKLEQSIQQVAADVQVNKNLSRQLAWQAGIVRDVLFEAQKKATASQLSSILQIATLKAVLSDAQVLLSEFAGANWVRRLWKRAKDFQAFQNIHQQLDASVQALVLKMMLNVAVSTLDVDEFKRNEEAELVEDSVTVKRLQEEARESSGQDGETAALLAEYTEILEQGRASRKQGERLGG
jgi:hypothetical protein